MIYIVIVSVLFLLSVGILTYAIIKSLKSYTKFQTMVREIAIGTEFDEVVSNLGKPKGMKISGKTRSYLFKAPSLISAFKNELEEVWIDFKEDKVI